MTGSLVHTWSQFRSIRPVMGLASPTDSMKLPSPCLTGFNGKSNQIKCHAQTLLDLELRRCAYAKEVPACVLRGHTVILRLGYVLSLRIGCMGESFHDSFSRFERAIHPGAAHS